jgi:hypothetical protein
MVINAYVDESYVEPRTFALGCAMARGMDWLEINRQWKRVLDRKNHELEAADGGLFPVTTHPIATTCKGILRGGFQKSATLFWVI